MSSESRCLLPFWHQGLVLWTTVGWREMGEERGCGQQGGCAGGRAQVSLALARFLTGPEPRRSWAGWVLGIPVLLYLPRCLYASYHDSSELRQKVTPGEGDLQEVIFGRHQGPQKWKWGLKREATDWQERVTILSLVCFQHVFSEVLFFSWSWNKLSKGTNCML